MMKSGGGRATSGAGACATRTPVLLPAGEARITTTERADHSSRSALPAYAQVASGQRRGALGIVLSPRSVMASGRSDGLRSLSSKFVRAARAAPAGERHSHLLLAPRLECDLARRPLAAAAPGRAAPGLDCGPGRATATACPARTVVANSRCGRLPALRFESPAAVGVPLEAHQRALSLVPGAVLESVRVAGPGGDLRAHAEVAGGAAVAAAGGQLVVPAQLPGGHPGSGVR
jgi:hypothetical protein